MFSLAGLVLASLRLDERADAMRPAQGAGIKALLEAAKRARRATMDFMTEDLKDVAEDMKLKWLSPLDRISESCGGENHETFFSLYQSYILLYSNCPIKWNISGSLL